MKVVCAIVVSWIGLALGAPPEAPSNAAELHYREGYQLLKQAEQGQTVSERVDGLQSAAAQLHEAIALQPNHYLARALLAQTLFGLTRELGDPATRRQTATAAQEQFAAAAKLPEADWRIYNAWGRFLLFISSESTDRDAVLQQARQRFEMALSRARWSTDKSAINNLYGQCLYQLAATVSFTDERHQYLKDSITHLNSATMELPASTDIAALRTLGNARLELGQQEHDSAMIRQALSMLQEVAVSAPHHAETHYSLSRAYALLGESDQALSELRQSLESGAATNLALQAEIEPAFAALRDRQDFRQTLTTGHNVTAVDPLIREGVEFAEKAEATDALPARLQLLKQASECFRQAARLQPDSAMVHKLWAQTLSRHAQIAPTATERRTLATEAVAQHTAAAAAPNADWQVYYSWGVLLQQLDRLSEASDKFEAGLTRTRVAGERRMLQRELAGCLLAEAVALPPTAEQTALLNRCLETCANLAPVKSSLGDTRIYSIWGRALILSGKLDGDRMKLRLAAEKLTTALELDAQNPELAYRLATVYALLNNKSPALRHLRSVMQNDPDGVYHRTADQDTDLNNLRSLPEFYDVLGRPIAPGS